jgi:hypothetical protein
MKLDWKEIFTLIPRCSRDQAFQMAEPRTFTVCTLHVLYDSHEMIIFAWV